MKLLYIYIFLIGKKNIYSFYKSNYMQKVNLNKAFILVFCFFFFLVQ